MVDTAVRQFGRLDILHNNAALTGGHAAARDTAITDIEADVLARILRVNVSGYALAAKHAIPHMLDHGGGVIIDTSAITADLPELVRPMYSMSKGAVNALTLNIAAQYGRSGIRAVGVAPGVIITPAVHNIIPQRMLDGFARHTLTPRSGTPEDVAQLVAFLVSDDAGFVTGETITVDGGLSAHYPNYADKLDALDGLATFSGT
jgi:NAD(P)-dependent dehydrogenase (short-subunit alcohol dehydrogenase family)